MRFQIRRLSLILFIGGLALAWIPVCPIQAAQLDSPQYAKKSSAGIKKKKSRKERKMRKSLQAWLNKMKKRISRSHAKHNQLVSVAAVRGNETPDSPPLYWKGKKSKGPVDLPELEEFDAAIEAALGGKKKDAILRLEKFTKTYPNSALKEDALYTLEMLRETP